MNINFKPTHKQYLAYQLLTDKTTNDILFGGAMAGGKSYLACVYLITNCMLYKGTRYLLGRAELKKLKESTITTFFKLINDWGLSGEINYNQQSDTITFKNGSRIVLMDLKPKPQDPNYTSLGSMEFTGAVIDECQEGIPIEAYRIIKTRLRHRLKEYNLIPKILLLSNPSRGWLYDMFYRPSVEGTLPTTKAFVPALAGDNEYNEPDYLATLSIESLGLTIYRVQVLGDWDYSVTELDLFEPDALMNSFLLKTNVASNSKYITIDPASTGKDSTVITVWYGYDCIQIVKLQQNRTEQIVQRVKELAYAHQVKTSDIVCDRIGVGTGVYDLLNCKGFVANARPFKDEPFANLKAQLYYKFAQLINTGGISISDNQYKDEILTQLTAHKKFNVDRDKKADVTPKFIVKKFNKQQSPDLADALTMRCWFEYKQTGLPTFHRL